jgi:hypothetical protein
MICVPLKLEKPVEVCLATGVDVLPRIVERPAAYDASGDVLHVVPAAIEGM